MKRLLWLAIGAMALVLIGVTMSEEPLPQSQVKGELRVAALQKGAGRIKLEIGGKIGREVSFDETG